MPTISLFSADAATTDRIARRAAQFSRPGLVVGLSGPLGAGKTRFVRAFAEALGADPLEVSSPTFVLVHEYASTPPVYHFDVYRLKSPDEFLRIGAEEYWTSSGGICLIEWADRVDDLLPTEAWRVRLEYAPQSPEARLIAFQVENETFDLELVFAEFARGSRPEA